MLNYAVGLLDWLTELLAMSVRAILGHAPTGIDLHDAATVQFLGGPTVVLSKICGVPQDYGVDMLIHGSEGSFIFDIAADRRVLKLPDGTTETANPTPGASQYSCEDPTNMLVDIALGHGVNQSTGHVSARAVETLHALTASGRENGIEFKITTTNQKAEIA